MVSGKPAETESWKRELAASFTGVSALLAALGLKAADIPDLDPNPATFRLLVPPVFAGLMRMGDPDDPLLRQVLPRLIEQAQVDGYVTDPVDDRSADCGHGLLRKYGGRSLLIATGACAIHCRYCFRRHFTYASLGTVRSRLDAASEHIAADPSVSELILSGGDPLLLDDRTLEQIVLRLATIGHMRRLRIHTRLPVVLPTRVTERLCAILASSGLMTVVVIHANHPRELGDAAEQALFDLRRAGVTLLNQSVLLHGVNDDPETLCQLSERLLQCGTLPYYLHQLDPVAGAAHFQVSDHDAIRLIETLRQQLPGYLLPRLVREIPGAASKMPL